MIFLIEVQVDENQLKKLYTSVIEKRLEQLDLEVTYWDTKELKRQTNMGWNAMQENFFHDPDFPKFKVGHKWYYPAEECRAYLIKWAKANRYKNKMNLSKMEIC